MNTKPIVLREVCLTENTFHHNDLFLSGSWSTDALLGIFFSVLGSS